MAASPLERPFNSWDIVKLLALLLMFTDHAGHFLYPDEQWLRAIGRGAAPIFMFLAGFAPSTRFRFDVLALALLMTLSNIWIADGWHALTILFNILACRMLFAWMERTGKHIKRPYEWYIGGVALIFSTFLVQYGTIGLLFAICGYMKRRGVEHYPRLLQQRFWMLTFGIYGLYHAGFGDYSAVTTLLMIITLAGVYRLLWQLEIRPVDTREYPRFAVVTGKFLARHSLYVYALHVLALQWMTGLAF